MCHAVVIRQRKAWRRKDGTFLYFEGMLDIDSVRDCALPSIVVLRALLAGDDTLTYSER